ncbi:MAG: PEP-CTERM sorting domain-containing protein [Pirellulales bacterium]
MKRVSIGRLSRFGLAATFGATVAMAVSTVNATLLWYDGFTLADAGGNYTAGATINGQSGGTGSFFTGPWQEQSDQLVLSSSLTRPGQIHPSVGGSVGDNGTDSCCITGRNARLFATPWGGFTDPDGTFYFGFLGTFGTGTLHHRVLEMWSGDHANDGNRNLQLGYSEFTGVGPNKMSISVHDSMDGTNHNATLSENVDFATDAGTVHYIVLKFAMSTSGNDVVSAYLDPVGTSEPVTASAQISVSEFLADRFGTISTFVFGAGTAPAMDELRVGSTFADVANNTLPYTAVPEPATVCLFGLGLVGLVSAARRRS